MQTKSYPFSIPIGDAIIRVTSETNFDILTEFVDFNGYEIPSTEEISPIMEVLRNDAWTEDHINAAVTALNAPQEALAAQELHYLDDPSTAAFTRDLQKY